MCGVFSYSTISLFSGPQSTPNAVPKIMTLVFTIAVQHSLTTSPVTGLASIGLRGVH